MSVYNEFFVAIPYHGRHYNAVGEDMQNYPCPNTINDPTDVGSNRYALTDYPDDEFAYGANGYILFSVDERSGWVSRNSVANGTAWLDDSNEECNLADQSTLSTGTHIWSPSGATSTYTVSYGSPYIGSLVEEAGTYTVYIFEDYTTKQAQPVAASWGTVSPTSYNAEYYISVPNQSVNNSIKPYVTYSVTANHRYTFYMSTNSQENYDGIVISTSAITSWNNSYQISNYGMTRCAGLNSSNNYTYTPSSNGTVYIYFRTNSSTIVDNCWGRVRITDAEPVSLDDPEWYESSRGYDYSYMIAFLNDGSTNCNNLHVPLAFPVTAYYQYTFNMTTYSESGFDGIVISTSPITSWPSGNISQFGVKQCSGEGTEESYSYTPTSDGVVYIYFRTDSSVTKVDYNNLCYGIVDISVATQTNSITYNTQNASAYCTDEAQVASSMVSAKSVCIASTAGSCLNGTLDYILYVTKNGPGVSGWTISNNGRYITIPAGTTPGTYSVSVNASSHDNGGWRGTNVTEICLVTVNAVTTSYCGDVTIEYMSPDVVDTGVVVGTEDPVGTGEEVGTEIAVQEPFSQHTSFPASAFTLTTSNFYNYFELSCYGIQEVHYTNGQEIVNTINTGTLSGSSTSFSSLGNNFSLGDEVEFNPITITFTGECGKTASDSWTYGMRSANDFTYSNWGSLTVSGVTYPTASACGETVSPSINASQTCTRTWTSGTVENNIAYDGIYGTYSMTNGNGFTLRGSLSGKVTVTARGKYDTTRSSNTVTVVVRGGDNSSKTVTTTVTQAGNTYTDSGGTITVNSSSTSLSYATLSACGETVSPTVSINASQSVTRTWGCSAGTDTFTNTTFNKNYTVSGSGFSINASSGAVTVGKRGKYATTRSGTVTLKISAYGATATAKTATVTQAANTYTDSGGTITNITASLSYSTISACGGTVSPTVSVSASQTVTRTWGCSSGTSTYTNNTFTKNYTISSVSGLSINQTSGAVTGTSIGKTTTGRSATVTLTISANGKSATAKTATVSQSGNTYTDTYSGITYTGRFVYDYISACGGDSTPITLLIPKQTRTRTWGCSAGSDSSLVDSSEYSYSYSMNSGSGFSINTSTGVVTATARGKYEEQRTSNTITVTISANGYSTTKTTTCTQNGNTYTDSWNAPSISSFSYATTIPAGSGSCSPTLNVATQTGTRTWGCNAGTDSLSNSSFDISYSMTASGRWSMNSSGVVSATTRGTTTGAAETSPTVTVTVSGMGETSTATATATQQANTKTWGNVSLTVSSPSTPYSMAVSGETKAISASASQSASYTSGETDSYTPDIAYTVKTSKTGYSLGTGSNANKVTVTNNTSGSARNGFVVTVTATGKTGTNSTYDTGYNKTATSDRTFNQAAGSKVYANPTVTGYYYANFAAAGVSNRYPTVTYTQAYTWNGVSGSGSTDSYTYDSSHTSPGGTRAFTAGTLPKGFAKGTSFASTGRATWANNTTQFTRDAASILSVTVTVNSKTSAAYTCTACIQTAGSKVYANPTVTGYYYANFAAAGESNKYPTVTYTQSYTWNGVSGSGSTDSYTYDSSHTSPGGTRAFTAGTLPTGFTKGTSFASTGRSTWANNTTTSTRDAASILSVTVTVNSKTSAAYTCTSCLQSAGAKVYSNPVGQMYIYGDGIGATSSDPTIGYPASGGTYIPLITFYQDWTWNGVSGSGDRDWFEIDENGIYTYNRLGSEYLNYGAYTGTYSCSFTSSGTLPTGFSKGSNFATVGTATWANRGTTLGSERNAKSNLSVTFTVNGKTSSSYACDDCLQQANELYWDDPVLTTSPASSYSMNKAGETKSVTYTASQSGVYTSGSTASYTPKITYTETTSKTGYSLSVSNNNTTSASGSVTVTNNTSTSVRNGYIITVTAYGKPSPATLENNLDLSTSKNITFNQASGSKSYSTPSVTFKYTNTAASGATNKTPSTVSYSQAWTWNGVSGSGGTITSGLTVGYTTTGTLPSGFSKGTNFATTGAITWANRGTTPGSQLNANSNIVLTISFPDQSRTYNPTGCTQTANALTSISLSVAKNPIDYNERTTCSVSATYTSGSSKDVTDSLVVNGTHDNKIVISDTSIIMMI